MLALAVNTLVLAGALFTPQKQLTRPEQTAWDQIRQSTVVVMDGAVPRGMAACIDSNGYFIAHRSAVHFPLLFAKNSAGALVELEVVSIDETTQLALLALKQKGVTGAYKPVNVYHDDKKAPSGALLAVLTSGPVRAELVSKDRLGLVDVSRKLITLSEIRFEASSQRIAGALVFTMDGQLVGVVDAALTSNDKGKGDMGFAATVGGGGGGTGGLKAVAGNQYGPGELTVAYSVAPNILDRVVSGFLSPSRKPAHPAIGIVCHDAKDGGAMIEQVVKGSAAEKAGIKPGDSIIEIGGEPIKDQIAFARVMQRQTVGSKVTFKIRRNGVDLSLEVEIGQSATL